MIDTVTAVALSIIAGLCAIPVLVVGWVLSAQSKRLADQNRELLKANLALSQQPAAMQHAANMEGTDRIQHEAKIREMQKSAPRMVGR